MRRANVDPDRPWPVVVGKRWSMPLTTWQPMMRRELVEAVRDWCLLTGGCPPELAETAGELAAADQLDRRGGGPLGRHYPQVVTLDAEQLAFYAGQAVGS